jgi:putative flippase GtrA
MSLFVKFLVVGGVSAALNALSRMRSEFVRFAIVNVFALLVVLGVTMFLARVAFPFIGFTWHAETVAHIAGILAPVFTSYLGHKHFTFQPKVKPI